MCIKNENGMCTDRGEGFDNKHTNYGKPVCDWFGWMFTHDDYNDTCKGCKK